MDDKKHWYRISLSSPAEPRDLSAEEFQAALSAGIHKGEAAA